MVKAVELEKTLCLKYVLVEPIDSRKYLCVRMLQNLQN